MSVTVLGHPLAQHLLTQLRDKSTSPETYRRLAHSLTVLLVTKATETLAVVAKQVETPLEPMEGSRLANGLAAIPILRAGLGMLEGVTSLFPDVSVGYIGLERNEETAQARSYYCKLPNLAGRVALCLDPMLATGGSASQAIDLIKQQRPLQTILVSIVSAPEGLAALDQNHPNVPVVTAAIDRGLDARKYILPGLGDFGDRLYGTFG